MTPEALRASTRFRRQPIDWMVSDADSAPMNDNGFTSIAGVYPLVAWEYPRHICVRPLPSKLPRPVIDKTNQLGENGLQVVVHVNFLAEVLGRADSAGWPGGSNRAYVYFTLFAADRQ